MIYFDAMFYLLWVIGLIAFLGCIGTLSDEFDNKVVSWQVGLDEFDAELKMLALQTASLIQFLEMKDLARKSNKEG